MYPCILTPRTLKHKHLQTLDFLFSSHRSHLCTSLALPVPFLKNTPASLNQSSASPSSSSNPSHAIRHRTPSPRTVLFGSSRHDISFLTTCRL